MPSIEYIEGNIYSHCGPKSVLAHSVSCVGAEGSSIARQISSRFPSAYQKYLQTCHANASNPATLSGSCLLVRDQGYWVAFLFTSVGTPNSRVPLSPKDLILQATREAVTDLLRQLHTDAYMSTLQPGDEYFPTINITQLNLHDFSIPWSETERLISSLPFKFRVYTLN